MNICLKNVFLWLDKDDGQNSVAKLWFDLFGLIIHDDVCVCACVCVRPTVSSRGCTSIPKGKNCILGKSYGRE